MRRLRYPLVAVALFVLVALDGDHSMLFVTRDLLGRLEAPDRSAQALGLAAR